MMHGPSTSRKRKEVFGKDYAGSGHMVGWFITTEI